MNKKEQWIFLQKVGRLLQASLPIGDCVEIAAKSIRNKKFRKIVSGMLDQIVGGRSLAESMSMNVGWDRPTIALVRAGEISENLSENLIRSAENMKMKIDQRTKIIGSLFYPAIIFIFASGMIAFLLTYVYPKIIPLFIGIKADLPFATRLMIYVSSMLERDWSYITGSLIIVVVAIWYSINEWIDIRYFFEALLIYFPFMGKVIYFSQLGEVAFLIGSLCQGGMTTNESMLIATDSISFLMIRKMFVDIHTGISSGISFSDCISAQRLPEIWNDLIVVGERTGTLSSTLMNISEFHKQESEEVLVLVNKLIEPTMMIAVGVVVGFIALSIITPMYSLTQQVHG